MIYLLFYLIGYIIAYYLCKQLRNMEEQNEWKHIQMSFLISTLSWIAIVILLVGIAMSHKSRKPPKGL